MKRAVAKIYDTNGTPFCTGTLINNTNFDRRGLFLLAAHCVDNFAVGQSYDFTFRWNYENLSCGGNTLDGYYETVGATILVVNNATDVALLEVDLSDLVGTNYEPYFAGWDISGNIPIRGAVIHHPNAHPSGEGQPKRISLVKNTHSTSNNCPGNQVAPGNWWRIDHEIGPNGPSNTNTGSSGSALFDQNKRVVGQLYGCNNSAACRPKFGKISVSYTGNNATSPTKRLDEWINPAQLNIQYLDPLDSACPISVSLALSCNKFQKCKLVANTTNGVPPFYFQWSTSDGPLFNSGSIVNNICESKFYTVTVTDGNGCVATASGQFSNPNGCGLTNAQLQPRQSSNLLTHLQVNDRTNVSFSKLLPDVIYSIQVYDVLGRLSTQQRDISMGDSVSLEIEGDGIFIVALFDESNKVIETHKVFVSK
ncbi:MAG: serine protease [Saprospiraceae bacterium]